MQTLTRNVGRDTVAAWPVEKPIKRILVCRPNHRLGNQLLLTPLIDDIAATFPAAKVDLFVKGGLSNAIFTNFNTVDTIIGLPKKPFSHLFRYFGCWLRLRFRRYDIAINVDPKSSSGKLSTKFSRARVKFYGQPAFVQYPDGRHIAKLPVYNFRNLVTRMGIEIPHREIAPLDLKLSDAERQHGKDLLDAMFSNDKKTICVFTYATGRKCYCEGWWGKFYEQLKARYVDYNILEILPAENVSQIGFKAKTFYSNDIREIASVIASTQAFVGADSGIMHLASASHTPTLGLFSVTDLGKYEPFNKGSIGLDTRNTHPREWFVMLNRMLAA
ncbi:glycosyltransferase family 9 protein [Flavobacterium sp. D33]|nr:glycosyltransferase family 9 protein [Flavobacterium selenitireducens]